MAQAYCTNCGTQIETIDQYCRGCGATQSTLSSGQPSAIAVRRATNWKPWLLIGCGGIVAVVVVLLVVVGFVLFTGATKHKAAAEEAVTEFHRDYNDSKFKLIFDGSHASFTAQGSFEEFDEFMTVVHRKLGLVTSTTNQAWEVLRGPHQLDSIGAKLSENPIAPGYDSISLSDDHLLSVAGSVDAAKSPLNTSAGVL